MTVFWLKFFIVPVLLNKFTPYKTYPFILPKVSSCSVKAGLSGGKS